MDERGLGVLDVGDVVGEGLAEEGVALDPGAVPQVRQEVQPRQAVRGLRSRGGEQGRRQVQARTQLGPLRRLQLPRPAEQDRRAHAALVGAALGAPGVAADLGLLDPAVVGDVGDQRVLGDALLVEEREQLAAGLVEPGAHREVPRDGLGAPLLLVGLQQPRGRVVGRVGQEGRVPDEEGLLRRAGLVDEVGDRRESLAADLQAVVPVPAALLGVAAGHPVGEAATAEAALPPLAGLEAEVAPRGEQAGEGGESVDVRDQQLARVDLRPGGVPSVHLGVRRIVAGDPRLVGVEPGDHGRERGPAEGRRHVPAAEGHALPRKPVDVGRADLPVPHEAVVRPGLVVGDDQDDVRGGGVPRSRSRGESRQQQAAQGALDHSHGVGSSWCGRRAGHGSRGGRERSGGSSSVPGLGGPAFRGVYWTHDRSSG